MSVFHINYLSRFPWKLLALIVGFIKRKLKMTASAVAKANSHMSMLLLLLLHLLISVCYGRPSASHHHSDATSPQRNSGHDDDDEPNVFAVFENSNPVSGKITILPRTVSDDSLWANECL